MIFLVDDDDNGIHSTVHADAKTTDMVGRKEEDDDDDDDFRNKLIGPATSIKTKTKHPANVGGDGVNALSFALTMIIVVLCSSW